jgi:hypothetical protein
MSKNGSFASEGFSFTFRSFPPRSYNPGMAKSGPKMMSSVSNGANPREFIPNSIAV